MPSLHVYEIEPGDTEPIEAKVHGNAFSVLYTDYDANAIQDYYGVTPELRIDHKSGKTFAAIEGATARLNESFKRIYLDPKAEILRNSNPNANVPAFDTQRVTIYSWDHRDQLIDIDAVRYPGPPTQEIESGNVTVLADATEGIVLGYQAPIRPQKLTALEIDNSTNGGALDIAIEMETVDISSATIVTKYTKIATVSLTQDIITLSDFDLAEYPLFGAYQIPRVVVTDTSSSDTEVSIAARISPAQ
jgi:hypothetical protein